MSSATKVLSGAAIASAVAFVGATYFYGPFSIAGKQFEIPSTPEVASWLPTAEDVRKKVAVPSWVPSAEDVKKKVANVVEAAVNQKSKLLTENVPGPVAEVNPPTTGRTIGLAVTCIAVLCGAIGVGVHYRKKKRSQP
ncbi:hypothetical protein HDU85_001817 [Gaertneriomyces sp. JEL0708]|nr:hypothetical protein HDU85_001817 [Gaertneriomyces sp. JEL0708]